MLGHYRLYGCTVNDTQCAAENFYSNRQSISNHNKILMECGLVKQPQQDREIYSTSIHKNWKKQINSLYNSGKYGKQNMTSLDKVLKQLNKKS
jgi:hypothetical protein